MRDRFRVTKILFAILVNAPLYLYSQITWETKLIEKSASLEAESVSAEFHFKNTGSKPIKILNVASTCGCVTAKITKNNYASGESGTVFILFTIGQRTGVQNKRILVQTDFAPSKMEFLNLKTILPEVAEVKPNHPTWKIGSDPRVQTVFFTLKSENLIKITQVESQNKNFSVTWEKGEVEKTYRFLITPKSTAVAVRGTIQIQTDYPAKRPRTFEIHPEIEAAL